MHTDVMVQRVFTLKNLNDLPSVKRLLTSNPVKDCAYVIAVTNRRRFQVLTCQDVTHKSSSAALQFGPVQLKQVPPVDFLAKFLNYIQPVARLLSQGLQRFFLHEKFRIRHSLHPRQRSC